MSSILAEKEMQINALKEQLDPLKSEVNDKKSKIEKLKSQMFDLMESISEYKSRLEEQLTQNQKLENLLNGEKDEITRKLEHKTESAKSLRKELLNSQFKIVQLEAQVKKMEMSNGDVSNDTMQENTKEAYK